jgi:hypothetical protein
MNANVSPKDLKTIEAYNAAKTAAEFQKLLGVTQKTAWHRREKLGLAPLPHSGRVRHPRADQVCEMFSAGKQLTEIAAELGMTRGSVAGIVNRAGLFKKRLKVETRLGPSRKANPDRIIAKPKFRTEAFRKRVSAAPFLGFRLDELTATTCRNPDPKCDTPSLQTYCGQPVYGAFPYCLACAQINYAPPQARNRDPRPR